MKNTQDPYRRMLGELSTMQAKAMALQGMYCGKPVNGYRKIPGSQIHQVDEKKREKIVAIFWFSQGGDYSLRTLALECQRIDLTNAQGNPMTYKSVWNMLTNPFYAGRILLEGELCPGRHSRRCRRRGYLARPTARRNRECRRLDTAWDRPEGTC